MSTLDWLPVIVSASGGGGVVGVIGTRVFDWGRGKSEKGKIDADAAQIIAQTAVALVAPLREEIADLRKRVELVEQENSVLRALLAEHAPHLVLPWETP